MSLKSGKKVALMKKTDMPCSSCQRFKAQLRPRRSKLLDTMLYLCTECFEKKREPRFAIILAGRRDGVDSISEYIKNKRYVGKDITLRELV